MKKRVTNILVVFITAIATCTMTFTELDSADATGDPSPSMPAAVTSDELSSTGQNEREALSFTAELQFDSAKDDHVTLKISNRGEQELRIGTEAHYMDQVGSAGSWDCTAQQETVVSPGNAASATFTMEQAASHGENSILAFYLRYDGTWYLAKAGERNGVECFVRHD